MDEDQLRLIIGEREEVAPFGPPPTTTRLRDWENQLMADIKKLRQLNPDVDLGTMRQPIKV